MAQVILPLFMALAVLGLLVAGSHLVQRPTLTLTATGIAQKTFYGELTRAWNEVEAPAIVQSVVWNLKPGAPPSRSWMRWLNRLCGYDEGLFGMWTLSPKALFELVQRYHAAATGHR